MRFVSIVTFSRNGEHPHESPETAQRMEKLVKTLHAQGVLVDTGGRDNAMMELSVTRKSGRNIVTDGPFAESKEAVGGYAVLEVKDRDQAIAVTNRFLDTLGADATCYLHEVFPAPEL
ncbi:MAG: transcriptional regulator [Candidatus Eremiobacteraeota bacterium]|nr:transcriptional regulator [Candidatus Eremiobacteraeota bacterium]MBV9057370.1 transcriptional regulator [Candidatus Eremiobacteraeota bacterium]MBV9699413.1 transcriptional regulator [Candidatus Eremiobacteraeota bacterium]